MGSFRRDFADALVASGIARWLSAADCRLLESILSSRFPWSGVHIAWHLLAGSGRFDWGSTSDAKASAFVRALALSRYSEVTILYSATEALRLPSSWLADHPDEAACNAEQFFGIGGSSAEPDLSALAEFETECMIWGMLPNPPLQRT
jgi:hypothetical protein